jgi:hypothetical protein
LETRIALKSLIMKERALWLPAVAILLAPFVVVIVRWCVSTVGTPDLAIRTFA